MPGVRKGIIFDIPRNQLALAANRTLGTRLRTEMYDRGEKFAHYRQLASLCDYLLVSQHEPRIEIFSRDGDRWIYVAANAGERVVLSAMEGAIDVDRVYAGIALEPRVTRWSVGT